MGCPGASLTVEGDGGPVVGAVVGSEQLAGGQIPLFSGSDGPATALADGLKPDEREPVRGPAPAVPVAAPVRRPDRKGAGSVPPVAGIQKGSDARGLLQLQRAAPRPAAVR